MQENERKDPKTWNDAESLVSEVLRDGQKEARNQSRRWFYAAAALLAALVITNLSWLYVFFGYDYVSQDGNGYNYYNSEVEGDVLNGAEK